MVCSTKMISIIRIGTDIYIYILEYRVVNEMMLKTILQPGRAHMKIRRMGIASRIRTHIQNM